MAATAMRISSPPTNRSPRRADPGWPGEERWIWLRLKLIADVGLVGLPNAGKSTFLAAVSAARPKIADYPFTTLIPQLGVVRLNASEEFVLADIPGLIEGAHEGVGLGDRFLGHVERCAVLLHLVDGSQPDPVGAWRTVREELEQYGQGLAEKPELLCLNKVDAMTPQARASRLKALERAAGVPVMLISGATGEQVPQVLRALADIVAQARTERAERPAHRPRCCRRGPWSARSNPWIRTNRRRGPDAAGEACRGAAVSVAMPTARTPAPTAALAPIPAAAASRPAAPQPADGPAGAMAGCREPSPGP